MIFGILLVPTTLKNCRRVAMFTLSCFILHLLRPVEHHLPVRNTMIWSSAGILLNDKARD